jgi:hypothetical protein
MAALMARPSGSECSYVVTEAKASKLKFAIANDVRALVYREDFCNEDDDRFWNRYRGIRSNASNRTRHARSSRCPRELFASLHGSCRARQRSGEGAIWGCPPHRAPDIPPPRLLNREDDWPPSAAGHKTSVECIKWLQARACSRPLKHPGFDFIDDALWRARGSGVKCATYFR